MRSDKLVRSRTSRPPVREGLSCPAVVGHAPRKWLRSHDVALTRVVVKPSHRVLIPPSVIRYSQLSTYQLSTISRSGEGGIILSGGRRTRSTKVASPSRCRAHARGGQTLSSGSHPSKRDKVFSTLNHQLSTISRSGEGGIILSGGRRTRSTKVASPSRCRAHARGGRTLGSQNTDFTGLYRGA